MNAGFTQAYLALWLTRSLRFGGVFFDVGAHHGWVSLCAARLVGPSGTVVAFEPSPPLSAILRYHVRINRILTVQIVVSAGEKTKISVPAITLDRFALETGLVLQTIKIDIKGAELKALRGALRPPF